MANNTVWQVLHFLCILAHIGMTVAGIATFAVNNISDLNSGDVNFGDFERARDWALDNFIHAVYPWAVAGIGSFGTIMNAAIFYRLLKVTKLVDQGTKNEQYFKRKVAFVASLILQFFMTAADISMGGVVAGKVSEKGDLAGPCALGIIAGAVSLATGFVDISQFSHYRQRKEGLGNDSIEISDA